MQTFDVRTVWRQPASLSAGDGTGDTCARLTCEPITRTLRAGTLTRLSFSHDCLLPLRPWDRRQGHLFLSCSALVNFSMTFPLCGFRAEEGGNSFLHRRCAEVRSQASWCATTNSMAAPACLVTRCVREPVMRRSYVHGECFKYEPWEFYV